MPDLIVPSAVIAATLSADLNEARDRAKSWRADDVSIKNAELTDPVLADVLAGAKAVGNESFGRIVKAIIDARGGEFKSIPNYRAAPAILVAYLQANLIDGWLYERGSDGHMHPRLVTDIKVVMGRGQGDEDHVVISLTSDYPFGGQSGRRGEPGSVNRSISFAKGEITKKTPADALLAKGYVRETQELKDAYVSRLSRFKLIMATGFAEQFHYTGTPRGDDSWRTKNPVSHRRVIMDVKPRELNPLRDTHPSILRAAAGEDADEGGLLPVPVETVTRAFDLKAHEFWTVNVNDLTPYKYDKSLREKLILPADQRELLDVLTTDLGAFTADIIEGKSAGNVVLAKGSPGVGKTLTAEVYSELVERPLYAIHSGVLGTTAESVRKALEEAFDRAQRWNAVMLLDEADVFVLARGRDIAQNAITAEFLRTLEYFSGLLFMTTNRSDEIDDAIISRCAALIDYANPSPDDARKIWKVLATQMQTELSDELLDQLIVGLPDASPRDMKMLLRLTLRMAASRGEELSVPLFARCAMFRGLHFQVTA